MGSHRSFSHRSRSSEEAVMVLGNVLKFHGTHHVHALVALGILTGAVFAPIGCGGDFSGCKASRTCPPRGGEAGDAGAGGESGGGADTGGSSGENTSGSAGVGGSSTGGTGGTGDMGGAGAGGSGGEDTEPPTIVSFTPNDGDEDVERDVTVRAELSEPIDEATVTNSSVALEGPDGEVTGTLTVDGNVVSFVTDMPFNVLGT